jgi:hypothetical protein
LHAPQHGWQGQIGEVYYLRTLLLTHHAISVVITNAIQLLESNAKPSHYMAGAKLTSPGRHASFWREECHPKTFWEAYFDFTRWFKNITGIQWDDRLDGLPEDEDKFRYNAPQLHRPVGALPPGKNPPAWQDKVDKSDEDEGLVYDTDSEAEDEDDSNRTLQKWGKRHDSVISMSSNSSSDSDSS